MIVKIKKLFGEKIHSVTKAAFLLGVFSLSSRMLGLVRDRILAGKFGAGDVLDIYYASFQIPNFIANLLILGTLSVAFIPVFTDYITKARQNSDLSSTEKGMRVFSESWEIANTILNFSFVAILLIYLVFFFSSPYLIKYIVPGFAGTKRLQALTMTRIMLLSPVFFCLSSIISSILYSFKCFFVVALAPIFYNIGIIFGAVVLTRFFGIYGLGMGVVLGAFMHLCIQIPTARSLGFVYSPKINLKHKGVREIGKLFLPRIFGIDSSQISLLIGSIIGSMLSKGSITIYNFSNNIQTIPIGLFGISFAVAAFPALSEAVAENKMEKFKECFSDTARKVLFLVIPSMVFILVLRVEIVNIILGTGKFSSANAAFTAAALSIFCVALLSQCLMPLTSRAFYSLHNTIIPVSTSIFCMFVNVVASLYFVSILEKKGSVYFFISNMLNLHTDIRVIGLVIAFTISSWLNFLILIFLLRKWVGNLGDKGMILAIAKFVVASLFGGVSAYLVISKLHAIFLSQSFTTAIFSFLTALLSGAVSYAVALHFMRSEELEYFVKKVNARMSTH